MTIEVTQADIDKGVKNNCWDCPLALALHRAGFKDATVGTETLWLGRKSTKKCEMPDEAREFVSKFDSYQHVKPFTFELPYNP